MDVDCGSARDRLGRTLGGRYLLTEVLGAGGTAVVYRASDATSEGSVAVKVLHDHLSRSEEVCRRFVREGQIGNVLDHPNIVRVLDHGATHEGCPYLVLELLEGESLEERRVRAGGRLDLWETLDFCDQLLEVLEVAHAKNVVHRDIKPSNLFVTTAGTLKVLDFGIARLVDDTSATSTQTGQMVGTPAFMPPEQALSRPRDVDARTDIWSVGATLFTLLSGEHVHIAETSSEHLVKAATLHARSLARALRGIPANVEALIARALAFDKTERWLTASSMRQELAFVRDEPGRRIGTSTSPPPERTPSNPNMPTLVGSMRTYENAATISSVERAVDEPEKSGDIDATMALGSSGVASAASSGRAHAQPRRRPWLLPFAIGSSFLLVLMTVLVLVLALRTAPVTVHEPAPVTAPVTAHEPQPSATPFPTAVPAVEPLPSVTLAAPAVSSAPPARPPVRPAPMSSSKKAMTTRKEVYGPF